MSASADVYIFTNLKMTHSYMYIDVCMFIYLYILCLAGWCSAWKLFALSSPYFLRRALPLGSPAAAGPQSILHGAAAAFVDDCTAYSDESSFAYVTTLSSPQLSSNLRTGRIVCVLPSTWKICLLVKTTWYPGGPPHCSLRTMHGWLPAVSKAVSHASSVYSLVCWNISSHFCDQRPIMSTHVPPCSRFPSSTFTCHTAWMPILMAGACWTSKAVCSRHRLLIAGKACNRTLSTTPCAISHSTAGGSPPPADCPVTVPSLRFASTQPSIAS